MPNMTLAIPEELHGIIKKHNEINWSEIARRAIWEQAKRIELLESIVVKSRLKEEDVEGLDRIIKKALRKRYVKK